MDDFGGPLESTPPVGRARLLGIPAFVSEHALPGVFLIAKDRTSVDVLLASVNAQATCEAEKASLEAQLAELRRVVAAFVLFTNGAHTHYSMQSDCLCLTPGYRDNVAAMERLVLGTGESSASPSQVEEQPTDPMTKLRAALHEHVLLLVDGEVSAWEAGDEKARMVLQAERVAYERVRRFIDGDEAALD